MLFNFALEALGTNVSCNKVSMDDYECNNLISSDFRLRKKGFLVEHFIKPPVDVSFNFPCHIHIFCVLLDPFVGRQQSAELEVYCASKPVPKTKHGKRQTEETPWLNCIQDDSILLYHPVSKICSPDQTRLCFFNPRFSPCIFDQYKNLMNAIEPHAMAEMKQAKPELLKSTTHLKIRISRIRNGSTPGLSNIEIWGFISSHVSSTVQKSIQDKYQATKLSADPMPLSLPVSSTVEKKKQLPDGVQIPEDFIDPFTCEIMTIPILLPSGKNVDKYSLDKYFDSEASHGRQPKDPFTGLDFSSNIKPVPNGPLKVRIDHFLSVNSHDVSIASVPRTLISMSQERSQRKRKCNSTLNISRLVNTEQNRLSTSSCPGEDKIQQDNSEINPSTPAVSISSASSFSSFLTSTHSCQLDIEKSDLKKLNCDPTAAEKKIQDTSIASIDNRTHDSILKDSLDNALFQLLGSASTALEEKESSRQKFSSCTKCKINLIDRGETGVGLYVFPCSHALCGSCLSGSIRPERDIQCIKCDIYFLRSEVIRAHSISSSSSRRY